MSPHPSQPGSSLRVAELPGLLAQAQQDARAAVERARHDATCRTPLLPHTHEPAVGRLVHGDNLAALAELVAEPTTRPTFVYLDPPFASAADYRSRILTRLADGTAVALEQFAYKDRWSGGTREYLVMLAARLILVRELLAEHGCVCVHVDWHAAHWVRVLLDEIFGANNFVNHLVWSYRSGGASRTASVPRKHDDLLVYRRGSAFRVRPLFERQYLGRAFMNSRVDARGRHYVDTILRDVLEGSVTLVAPGAGDDTEVRELSVRPVLNVSGERTGYATQKPEGLLEVLLRWFTDPGDLVLDPFGGSGTTAVVAARLGRSWLSIDSNAQAQATARLRLDAGGFDYLVSPAPADSGVIEVELVCAAEAKVRLLAAVTDLPDTIRPARGTVAGAVELVRADPLAAVAGWGIYHREHRLVSSWRARRGQLATELVLPAGQRIQHLTVQLTDLAGQTRCTSLVDVPRNVPDDGHRNTVES